jgi:uncharacterized phage-associated protein
LATAIEAAKYITWKHSNLTTMMLQKLLYYSQAWSLVWNNDPIIDCLFEAWKDGPVSRELFNATKGKLWVNFADLEGDFSTLTDAQKRTIDSVLQRYGKMTPEELSDLSHNETPWKNARGDLSNEERSSRLISPADVVSYYTNLEKTGSFMLFNSGLQDWLSDPEEDKAWEHLKTT